MLAFGPRIWYIIHPFPAIDQERLMKNVLITGASSGIGYALALELAVRGCRLFLLARRKEQLEMLVKEIDQPSVDHQVHICDVSDLLHIRKVSAKIQQTAHIDTLILNAGVAGGGFDPLNMETEKIARLFQINFFGSIAFIQEFIPQMVANGSGIVAVTSSLAGYRGMPKSAPYSSSKAALNTFMSSLRIDLLDTGIQVTVISPGFVKTPLTDKNDFYMPFMISAQKAAKIIAEGLESRKNEIHFPKRLSWPAKIARWIPESIWIRLMKDRR
jgi:short-subunit dehydrogenase